MVLREFPDLQWLKKQADQGFKNRKDSNGGDLTTTGWPNVILKAHAKNIFRDNIRGPLSIFTNRSGQSVVSCDNKRAIVKEGFFYITNHDQRYTLEIDRAPTETLNIHFGEYFADQVFASISRHPEKLLEQEFTIPAQRFEFHNNLYRTDMLTDRLVATVDQTDNNKLREDENLYHLLLHLVTHDNQVKKIERSIPALKKSTRSEILKRLMRATDYIYSYYEKDISLEALAAVSCLSKFHFLRLFKIAFGQTPHQFITTLKINEAKSKLTKTSDDVHIIAKSLGFVNTSAFSRSFYNQVKVYPSQFRNSV